MTKIIGILSWFDESPTWLAATISSMASICDHVVAVDGRYCHYDDPRIVSSMAEHDAIVNTARGSQIGLSMLVPTRTWRDEMEKRTAAFQMAQIVADAHTDWAFVLDGDEVLVENRLGKARVIEELDRAAAAGVSTVTVTLRDIADQHKDEQRTRFGQALAVEHVIDCRVPRLFRMHENMRVVGYHYNYIGDDEHGNPIELWGNDETCQHRTPWACFTDDLVIDHRHEQRALVRKRRRAQYYEDRDACGIEKTVTLSELEQDGAKK